MSKKEQEFFDRLVAWVVGVFLVSVLATMVFATVLAGEPENAAWGEEWTGVDE